MEEVVKEEEIVTETPEAEEVVTTQPGEKTDSALLLKSLQDEREKRRVLEEELKKLQDASQGDIVTDEGKALLKKISDLESDLDHRKTQETLTTLQTTYPALKDKAADFQIYVEANPGLPMDVAAKAFLVDNNLLTGARKGLERSTGGSRAPQSTGITPEEADNLRVTNFRKYSDMVRKGEIKFNN